MVVRRLKSLYGSWGRNSLRAKLLLSSLIVFVLSAAATSLFFLKGTQLTRARLPERQAERELDYVLAVLARREDAISCAGYLLAGDPAVAEALAQDAEDALSKLNAHAAVIRDRFELAVVQIHDEEDMARASVALSSASSSGAWTLSLLDLAESGVPVVRLVGDRLLLLRRFPLLQDAGTVVIGIDLETELTRIRTEGHLVSDLGLTVRGHSVTTRDQGSLEAGSSRSRESGAPEYRVTSMPVNLGSTPAELLLWHPREGSELVTMKGVVVALAGGLLTVLPLSGLNLMVLRSVERPTVALSRAARRLADGDLDCRVELGRNPLAFGDNDELGETAESFNRISDRLSELCADLEAKVEARTAELETVAEVARAASSSLEALPIVREAAQIIRERLDSRIPGLHRVGVYAIEGGSAEAVLIGSVGDDGEQVGRAFSRFPIDTTTPVGLAACTLRPQALSNARLATAPVKPPLLLDTSSAAAAPLVIGDELIGVLSVESMQPDAFGPDTLNLLACLADQIALGVHNANRYERLRFAARHCADQDRAKSEFVREMSLELQAPADTVTRLSGRLLKNLDKRLSDPQREDLQRIGTSVERLQGIVDAIVDVSLLDAAEVTLRPALVNVRDAIESAAGAAASLLDAKGNSLLTDLRAAPSTIRAEGSALRQIVYGLLSTAAEIGEAGCIEVRARSVRVFYDDTNCKDPLLLVTVSHPAACVPGEELGRLCQAPARPDGVGLDQPRIPAGPGFPVAKRLVEKHGGRIWVENGSGRGMSFSFVLPVDACDPRYAEGASLCALGGPGAKDVSPD